MEMGLLICRLKVQSVPHMKIEELTGQKGTNGIQLSASDMMFSENGVQPDIVINPNAIEKIVAGMLQSLPSLLKI